MSYSVKVNGKEHAVSLRQVAPGRFVASAFGKEWPLAVVRQADGTLSIAAGDDRFDAQIDPFEHGAFVDLGVTKIFVEALTLREAQKRKLQEASAGGAGDWQVRSPMPGKVVSVLVAEGAVVKKGQGLVVIEAMKMENELRAPDAGIIKEIQVKPGQTVVASAVLLAASSK
ncbi:MAG: biotin/lipoyl-binding protein [Deltaproteobacteria bacterium]|nr:biotin/lipoyl-binding protein [Deltaproteobacteria bacterium]